jgi:hypothetical protein
MTYHRFCNKSYTSATCGAGTAYPSGASEFSGFSGVPVALSLVFCAMCCRLLFVLFLLTIVLSVLLRFTASDYPFDIFKLFMIYL